MKTLVSNLTTCRLAKLFFTLVIVLTASISADAQSFEGFPDFGEFTADDYNLKEVPFDKEANAVIIHHLARTDYNADYNMITEHRVRIKVLSDKGLAAGDIGIGFYSKDNFEIISGTEATVVSPNEKGNYISATVDRKGFHTVKLSENFSELRVAIPNIKPGSIFEYKYTVNAKNYNALRDWYFQTSLPTILNFYRLAILPTTEFTYKVYKLPQYPIDIDKNIQYGVSFKMKNIPGLRDEAYMDSEKDNLQHVTFQLSGFNNYGANQKYINKWEDASRELLSEPALGGQLNKSLSGTDDFIKTTKLISDPFRKVKAVYDFVQQRMTWNGYYGKYSNDGIKSAWDKRTGTTGEINLIFVNLLKETGVTASVMLANDRDDGRIDISYPFIEQFRKLVAYITVPNGKLIVDASDRQTPLNMVPLVLLNTYGYKIDKKDNGLILIEDDKRYYENNIAITGLINNDNVLEGDVSINSSGYAKLERTKRYKANGIKKFQEQYLYVENADISIDSLKVLNLDNDSLPLVQQFNFKQQLNAAGDFTFIDYHLFDNLRQNPFKSDMRFSDINFGSPKRYRVNMNVQIPDSYTVEEKPKNTSMRTPDTSFRYVRAIQFDKNMLSMQMEFEINRSFFERDEYSMLQAFYSKLFGFMAEQIVLKKKQ